MKTLKIPESHIGVSKTFRIPSDIITDIEALSDIKNTSLNQITILLLKFALESLDDTEKKDLENYKKSKSKK